jgi:creatinine amidohydrolase/Fe(II)-dependent formamide hydrolase-like protein
MPQQNPSNVMIHAATEPSSTMLHAQRSIVDSKKLTDTNIKKAMQ